MLPPQHIRIFEGKPIVRHDELGNEILAMKREILLHQVDHDGFGRNSVVTLVPLSEELGGLLDFAPVGSAGAEGV